MKPGQLPEDEIERRITIVSECGGIVPNMEAFYIQSIIYCASRAQEAFIRYEVSLASQSSPGTIVSTVHEGLTHAASLSRFFWPSQKNKLHALRSKKLRAAFQISENSCLKDRSLRNALEHFDERLDFFLLKHNTGHFFPSPIVDDQVLADEPTAKIFKLVDPKNNVFVILNEKFEFSEISQQINEVLQKAEQFDREGSRLPS